MRVTIQKQNYDTAAARSNSYSTDHEKPNSVQESQAHTGYCKRAVPRASAQQHDGHLLYCST